MMLSKLPSLTELFEQHHGRVIHKFPHHIGVYEKLFAPLNDGRDLTILEIGLADGGSLELWRKYFGQNATIIGVDIQDKSFLAEDVDAKILVGDQGKDEFWQAALPQIGRPDIIIDDGSHMCLDQLVTFSALFEVLNDGGLYIVEDIHTSYRAFYGGGLKHPCSLVEYLKRVIDNMHSSEHAGLSDQSHIFSLQIYPNLAVIEKRNPGTWGGSTMRPA
jgi:hypothetical protein